MTLLVESDERADQAILAFMLDWAVAALADAYTDHRVQATQAFQQAVIHLSSLG